ncbi:response regulator [Sulfitobacter geojensis]|uniref:response regulator n=2 Tax=Sulfitobacter geojensis TaxID=1342299 RepID=UPI00046A5D8B|nr:response regulator [Sulfitobacter geojensis]KHA51204.1 Two-component response regulator [Sulfitobacter geojensis]
MKPDMNILLVEDNDIDVEILKRSLRKLGSTGSLMRAKDGVEALEILSDDVLRQQLVRPYVILLDINMPRMNGHEFLAQLRQTEGIKSARVFVFTTSASKKDIELAYENYANGYIVKPDSSSELSDVLKTLQEYWSLCKMPDAA